MDSEGAVQYDFIHGSLNRDGAIHRLIGLGLRQEDAECLVSEWIDEASYADLRASGGIVGDDT